MGVNEETWKWRRRLFAWEEKLARECVDLLYVVVLQVDAEDRWSVRFHSSFRYTVSSASKPLIQTLDHDAVDNGYIIGYNDFHHILWIKEVPLKVSMFA